ncbi:MAG: hypothetical protein ACD_38C00119G0007 [uncultured bacterium]|uniref:Plasmid stabilization system n=1 Tax=Candidatus Daviesbacteria bacterium GW2011_GWC2_40_12 TaxID=1618431 RepID=A0A0G0QNF3_9BACT|nr:MAG: hypothetical protein ACD_38C00119G0007 [uncultured bacterium]KKQ85541.1 MAG: hypothetical protein UT04_C0002G0013 [Candidatus Daviesbacteria bacterium GW2011_GWF2_38_7]KKR16075.1 MAG: hypothetical protein UT45_C0009G0015 [Candidatus Daviesbacteria bacterium GW2011_GWA2_39_33]KKR41643.1 MAG: hypothetical protein UT77_C0008G0015 [Candidatus Daviesbacteria bacterium GW2011_GWC2_40_12]OGE22180.1 MAG: hypothetical protein A2778_03480 [Candidatus Daviesbacteria bacterium RIFCSPHIGHO2_01_FULL_
MKIKLHKNFQKHYIKLTSSQKKKFKERRDIFLQDEFNPILNNHALKGTYMGYRSINITGDLRAIFRRNNEEIIFVAIDSHSNLYG